MAAKFTNSPREGQKESSNYLNFFHCTKNKVFH